VYVPEKLQQGLILKALLPRKLWYRARMLCSPVRDDGPRKLKVINVSLKSVLLRLYLQAASSWLRFYENSVLPSIITEAQFLWGSCDASSTVTFSIITSSSTSIFAGVQHATENLGLSRFSEAGLACEDCDVAGDLGCDEEGCD
jgi:hypothetical protein